MRHFAAAVVLVLAVAGASPAGAQSLAFDSPEAWALKWFVAATTFTPLAPPRTRAPGAIEVGLEAGWIPHLSESQRRVGFAGTALEDLNKTPVLGRVRAAVGLPGGFTAEVGWVPPVNMRGAKANLLDFALERPFFDSGPLALGLRGWGQVGHAKGDVTCPEDVVAQPPGSAGNPLGCQARSVDTSTLNAAGAALTGGVKLGAISVHAAGGATYNDVQFQVGAITNGFHDSTLLRTHGWTGWVAGGLDLPVAPFASIGAEAFYSPLTVKRPPSTMSEDDGLFNVRGILRLHFP